MNFQSSCSSLPSFQGHVQELHIEWVRHYADVLRMLTERIPSVVSVPVEMIPEDPVAPPEILETAPDPFSDWESAESLLVRRDYHAEMIIHLWLQPA